MENVYSTIDEALEDLRNGKIIVVSDDEDRENEGDLICAAEFATTENINFMATYAKGLICMPMSKEITNKLNLNQMVTKNTDNHETAFTVSIDHVETTTGISAVERSITALKVIDEAIEKENPDVVLSVGQAGGRTDITVERIGINIDDCRIPDNAGQQIIDEPVFEDGPAAYFSNLPIKAMVARICEKNIPAAVSNTAGTFVCNHVLYGVRYIIETKYPGKRSGFIHIPFLPEQVIERANTASMSLSTIVEGLCAAIEAIVDTKEDLKVTGGATH